MSLLEDKDERFKNLFGKSAIFILVATIGIVLAFILAEIKHGAFTAMSPIHFVADSGTDLREGMPVKFSGFKIGKLNELTLDELGNVQVEVNIETKYLGLIRQDAVMTLKKEGVIGDGVLEISRGAVNKPALKTGGVVGFKREVGLEQAVVDVKNRVIPILDDLYDTLHDPQGDVHQTLKNLRKFSTEMLGTRERIDRMLDSIDGTLNQDVGPMLESLRSSADSAASLSDQLDRELPELLHKADETMDSLHQASETLNNSVQRSAPQLPGMIEEANETLGKTQGLVGDTQEVVDSLNSTWPFNKNASKQDSGPIRMDSHD